MITKLNTSIIINIIQMCSVNHDLKAIFIHIPKNGGTYIGTTLVQYYGFNCYLDKLIKRRPDHDIICNTNYFPNSLFVYPMITQHNSYP